MTTISPQKIPFKYFCEKCHYGCNNKKDYNRHLSTRKHKMTTNTTMLSPKLPAAFPCEFCGKEYLHRASLYNHKRRSHGDTCLNVSSQKNENEQIDETNEELKNVVMMLLKENKEIQKNFVDMIPYIKGNVYNTSYTSNTNTNNFNVQMFLNNHCKDAMNLTEFIESLPITNETYDQTIENGLTKTITTMITNGLNNMNVLERPIHCTDPARKIMYVKDNDVWEKDNDFNVIMHGIKSLTDKQRMSLSKWQEANSGWERDENLQTRMTKLVYNSMTNVESDEKEISKIIRAIGKNTYLNNEIKDSFK